GRWAECRFRNDGKRVESGGPRNRKGYPVGAPGDESGPEVVRNAGSPEGSVRPPTLPLPHKGGGDLRVIEGLLAVRTYAPCGDKSPPPLWGRVRVGGLSGTTPLTNLHCQ